MDSLATLMKRKHVASYNLDVQIPKETVEHLLHKTWQATSSKNNFMPYSVHVLGPDKKEEKILVWNKCVAKQKYSENKAAEAGKTHIPSKGKGGKGEAAKGGQIKGKGAEPHDRRVPMDVRDARRGIGVGML